MAQPVVVHAELVIDMNCQPLPIVARQDQTRGWYEAYYTKNGADRNDLRTNRGVLFQVLAWETSLVQACYAMHHDPAGSQVLDVGCGSGGDLHLLLRLRYAPENITGIDVLPHRLSEARRLYPHIRLIQGDASRMEFAAASFDLVFESTLFATLPDDTLSAGIAAEMLRVCRPQGYVLLADWWTPKPRDRNYKALTKRRVRELFRVGTETRWVGTYRGALVPPVGRFLSKYFPSSYFSVAKLFPFLVGQVAYLLQRMPPTAAPGPAVVADPGRA